MPNPSSSKHQFLLMELRRKKLLAVQACQISFLKENVFKPFNHIKQATNKIALRCVSKHVPQNSSASNSL
jgi:phosphoenolpyruvate carboxylase